MWSDESIFQWSYPANSISEHSADQMTKISKWWLRWTYHSWWSGLAHLEYFLINFQCSKKRWRKEPFHWRMRKIQLIECLSISWLNSIGLRLAMIDIIKELSIRKTNEMIKYFFSHCNYFADHHWFFVSLWRVLFIQFNHRQVLFCSCLRNRKAGWSELIFHRNFFETQSKWKWNEWKSFTFVKFRLKFHP